jgi:hypothetical protein
MHEIVFAAVVVGLAVKKGLHPGVMTVRASGHRAFAGARSAENACIEMWYSHDATIAPLTSNASLMYNRGVN